MILTTEQVLQVAKSTNPNLPKLRMESQRLKMNILGEGYLKYIVQKNGLETAGQIELRKKSSISNRGEWAKILNYFDAIFSAKGGGISCYSKNMQPDKVKELLLPFISNNTDNAISLKQFVNDYYKLLLMTEPNGATLVDGLRTGGRIEKFRYINIPISVITNYKRKGVNKYEYIAFAEKPVAYTDNENKYPANFSDVLGKITKYAQIINVIDDYANYIVIAKGSDMKIAPFDSAIIIDGKEYQSVVHGFDYCPVIANSNFAHDNFSDKQSPAWDTVELSEQLLEDNSTRSGFKHKHGYPIYWEHDLYECEKCNGTGTGVNESGICPSCNGTGKKRKDVSNVITIERPEYGDEKMPQQVPAGYITPPIESLRWMDDNMQHNRELLQESFWGTIIDPSIQKTATGQIIDQQPVIRRLDSFTKAAEAFINGLANLVGNFVIGNQFTETIIRLGDTYLILSPQVLLKQYNENYMIPNDSLRTDLLNDYYQHKYSKHPAMLMRKEKELKIEPYPHDSVVTVLGMAIPQKIKDRKMFFGQWNNTKTDTDYVTKSVESLLSELDAYIQKQGPDIVIV